ncbi:DUF1149 family protein [Enterococcus sp. BWB1-3]|uniref:DUF1149 family protein n=1 Tax=unclassified Enterococcus TaxID=2608891 RepID=UPI0019209BAF|nr:MULTISPECIES: DUF1149 family protein [unclassified Enterococcus]MBL1229065.1 DUF1149 family protein [Enterococcus sp. BWB1-3]MCB5953080.1 DUF1149 family protein [Enterococcus sp. BWT-B8]MCB5955440.1 DUF1149 family protein [Enterococcus sp. CWB-B31]
MEIKRQQEVVEAFHYDMRAPETEVKTELRVGFSPIESKDENYPAENTIIAARLEFRLAFDEFVLSGSASQISHIINQKIEKQSDLSQADVDELIEPLFSIIQRLAYEVTEIALDKPGIQLNFQSGQPEQQEDEK